MHGDAQIEAEQRRLMPVVSIFEPPFYLHRSSRHDFMPFALSACGQRPNAAACSSLTIASPSRGSIFGSFHRVYCYVLLARRCLVSPYACPALLSVKTDTAYIMLSYAPKSRPRILARNSGPTCGPVTSACLTW
jgi:hypothetical protein